MTTRILSLFLLFALVGLAGCGSSGGGGSSQTGSGTLGLFITDNPISDGTIKSVCVTYHTVELLGDGRHTLFDGDPSTFDLLQLRDHARPLSFSTVPVGDYDKIRLTLVNDGIELKLDDSACGEPGDAVYPHLPGNNKLDFVVRGGIAIEPDEQVYYELDLDAEKAIHVVQMGDNQCRGRHRDTEMIDGTCSRFNFRPVVFVRALDDDYSGKLIRLVGTIESIDTESRSLLLCDALPGMDDDPRDDDVRDEDDDDDDDDMDNDAWDHCVRVRVSGDDSFFDGDGLPRPLSALQRTAGMRATVNGKLAARMRDDDDDDDDEYDDYPLVVDALTIGLGETLLVEGPVESAPVDVPESDDDAFTMNVDRPDPLTVHLQAAVEGGNGTRIIDRLGNPLTSAALFPPRPVRVDGVYDDVELLMRGELVVLLDSDALGLVDTTRLSGNMSGVAVDGSGFILVLDGDDPDNTNAVPSLSDQSVNVPADARILLIDTGDGSSESLSREQLALHDGAYINLYARRPTDGLGSWQADTVLVMNSGTSIR